MSKCQVCLNEIPDDGKTYSFYDVFCECDRSKPNHPNHQDGIFKCAECGDEFDGAPYTINGAELCHCCKDTPLFTRSEIAQYLAGWTMAPFGEAAKLGAHVAHNALNQLMDSQDGIESFRNRHNNNNPS